MSSNTRPQDASDTADTCRRIRASIGIGRISAAVRLGTGKVLLECGSDDSEASRNLKREAMEEIERVLIRELQKVQAIRRLHKRATTTGTPHQ